MTENEGVRRAERATASIVAEYPFPKTYDDLHTLLALAYLKGSIDELRYAVERTDEAKDTVLRLLESGDVA